MCLQKVKAHLSQDEFAERFPDVPLWCWVGNQAADSRAQDHARKHADWARAEAVDWVDKRVAAVAEHLVSAAELWVHKVAPYAELGKVHGPKEPTKQQFLCNLPQTHPHHVWGSVKVERNV